jgi:hypothetical protein
LSNRRAGTAIGISGQSVERAGNNYIWRPVRVRVEPSRPAV